MRAPGGRDPVARLLHVTRTEPDAVAVLDSDGPTTYAQFWADAAGFARAVRELGGSVPPKVALILRGRRSRTYSAMFGTLLAGGSYAPINSDWPPVRIADALRQLRPDCIVTDHDIDAAVRAAEMDHVRVLHLDDVEPTDATSTEWSAGESAYVIFTSGSTGAPKGVMIGRSSLANYLDWIGSSVGPRVGDRWSQHADISFDLSVLDIFGALCFGATLCPMETRADRLFPARFVQRRAIDIWVSVPSVVDAMLAADSVRPELLGSIRIMVFCGEALRAHHVAPLFDALPDVVILNTYGPTENTVSCTEERLTGSDWRLSSRHSIAIGEPIPGTRLMLHPDRDASSGEILLGGDQLTLGYLGGRSVARGAFMSVDGERWYRTGDLAEIFEGRMYFVGRFDSQIKLRGHRIELDEIAGAASSILGSAAAAVLVGDRIVLACEGGTERTADLADHLRTVLPDYMVPSTVVPVAHLPRTGNGKIDRAGLLGLLDREEGACDE